MKLSLEEEMEFWKQQFQDTKKLLVTSAKGKQDCGNWDIFFSLCLKFDMKEMRISFFHIKAAVQRCFSKKSFLKINQYSQENTCAEVSF